MHVSEQFGATHHQTQALGQRHDARHHGGGIFAQAVPRHQAWLHATGQPQLGHGIFDAEEQRLGDARLREPVGCGAVQRQQPATPILRSGAQRVQLRHTGIECGSKHRLLDIQRSPHAQMQGALATEHEGQLLRRLEG